MKLSKFFFKNKMSIPFESMRSYELMLKTCMVDKSSAAGIYTWMPMGLRVLKKIENIVRKHHDKECSEILMPTIQPIESWKKTNRADAYGKELLKIKDRHDREFVYGPTAEDFITEMAAKHIKSYKDMSVILYDIQLKFRDEIRPKHNLMRSREFLMSAAYSFDKSKKDAVESYKKMIKIFTSIFDELGVKYIIVKADPGEIGGDYSHEFQIILGDNSKVESGIYYTNDSELKQRDIESCIHQENKGSKFLKTLEVGHCFYFGDKYSKPMKFKFAPDPQDDDILKTNITSGAENKTEIKNNHEGYNTLPKEEEYNGEGIGIKEKNTIKENKTLKKSVERVEEESGQVKYVEMGSYGIGISRLVQAIIESSHDERGIVWPESVAPFEIILTNISKDSNRAEDLYKKLSVKREVLYDDRPGSFGLKIKDAELIGSPYIIIVSDKSPDKLEIKKRKTNETFFLTESEVLEGALF